MLNAEGVQVRGSAGWGFCGPGLRTRLFLWSARGDRAEISVEPSQDVSNQIVQRRQMPVVVDAEPLAIGGRAEQIEERLRDRLERKDEIVAALQHQRGGGDVRREIERI